MPINASIKEITGREAKEFENTFDDGESVLDALGLTKAKRVLQGQKRVNVGFSAWMIESLDKEANRVGVTRQSIMKIWLAERLVQAAANKVAHIIRKIKELRLVNP